MHLQISKVGKLISRRVFPASDSVVEIKAHKLVFGVALFLSAELERHLEIFLMTE